MINVFISKIPFIEIRGKIASKAMARDNCDIVDGIKEHFVHVEVTGIQV